MPKSQKDRLPRQVEVLYQGLNSAACILRKFTVPCHVVGLTLPRRMLAALEPSSQH